MLECMNAELPPKRRPIALYVIIAVIVLLALWSVSAYNALVTLKGAVDGAWAQVETQYQRRFDVIPNVVNTVKGAADFEQQTLLQVTQARTQWQQASAGAGAAARTQQIAAVGAFDAALSRLIATVEAYPQLGATAAFQDLTAVIEGTENRIATARRDYNEAVREYNVRTQRFPTNTFARLFGFLPETFFASVPGSEVPPAVDFGTSSPAR